MDDLSRALDEDLMKDLVCPVCLEYMLPPIKLCTNGHNICNNCRKRVQRCPTCRAEFLETRNVALENFARRLKYPCENRQSGCLEFFSNEHIAKHQAGCVYGKIKCPVHLLNECSWNGFKNDLKEHAKAAHPKYFLEGPTFHRTHIPGTLAIISPFNELFTYYKQKKDGRYYAAVQLIGTSSEASKYKCEFTLRAADGVDQISYTFLVQGYSVDFETIFKSGICINLDEEALKFFVKREEVKMKMKLSKV